jgi:hypothetical protein
MREYLKTHVMKRSDDVEKKVSGDIGKLEVYRLFISREIQIYK